MDRSSRHKISKKTLALSNTLHLMNLMCTCRTSPPKAAEYTFSSSVHETFSEIYHMLGHKTSVNKFKQTEIISVIFL